MTGEYRQRVDALLEQLEGLRHRQYLLQAAGIRGRAVAKLERKTERLRSELAATIAARVEAPS